MKTIKEIYEMGLKDKALVDMLFDNGYHILDWFSYHDFRKAMGTEIKD
jgi:hypothetical protein